MKHIAKETSRSFEPRRQGSLPDYLTSQMFLDVTNRNAQRPQKITLFFQVNIDDEHVEYVLRHPRWSVHRNATVPAALSITSFWYKNGYAAMQTDSFSSTTMDGSLVSDLRYNVHYQTHPNNERQQQHQQQQKQQQRSHSTFQTHCSIQ